MKKFRKAIMIATILSLIFAGNYVYGYYIGYNAKYVEFYEKVISPDHHYAIEIQSKDNLFLVDPSQIIYCEDLTTNKKVEYLMTRTYIFNPSRKFDEIFKLEWLDDRALLTVWQEDYRITTYILEWDKIFPSQNQ